jgi:NSS family neurotransmitter:Na+ symporter
MSTNKESWGSRIGLILAMAGNAVGLGNFLRFPVQAMQNGGGAFIIPYLVCFVVMGIPLLWIEWATGRYGGKFGYHAAPFAIQSLDPKRAFWKYVGIFGLFTNVTVAAYYCYLESWTLSYVFHSISGTFRGLAAPEVAAFFDGYVNFDGLFGQAVLVFLFCVVLNTWILSRGLAQGVEITSKVGMPLLILFGFFLAYKGITLTAGEAGATSDGTVGLNFLWTPQFDSLWNPKVWLAAAGQIFFTLSVGMATIHCYASYLSEKEDIALNAMSAGWMNEFVEVVLGSAVLIPISVGYLGIDRVVELTSSGGLGLGFRTMPYLFQQWGDVIGALAGLAFFGLLFFAGITSSLAMGSPWIAFMMDEYRWSRNRGALTFGLMVVVLGLPTVFFFAEGVFDEYDYWTGTVSLFVFALLETILFSWVFGLNKGWAEISAGADIRIPGFYRFIITWVTPLLLLFVFIGALVQPAGGDWGAALRTLFGGGGWALDNGSILAQLQNQGIKQQLALATDAATRSGLERKLTYINGARILLLAVFVGFGLLIRAAWAKRLREGRAIQSARELI